MKNVGLFAVKSIGLSTVNGRKPCTLLQAARHNLREIQAEHGADGHIDAARIKDNQVLEGPHSAREVEGLAGVMLQSVNTAKLKRDHCQAIEAVFSLPDQSHIQAGPYFEQCLEWVKQALCLPVLSAVIHYDESAPHAHVLMLPIRDGKHVGSAPIDKPSTKRLRESFFAHVAGPHGLKRDTAKLRGMVKKWAVEAVLRKCDAVGCPALIGPLWPVLVAAIKRDPSEALAALAIDLNSIRPTDDVHAAPIGLHTNPIGLAKAGEEIEALSCVGLAIPTTAFSPPSPALSAPVLELVRVRESSLDPALYNPETGEYFQQTSKPVQHQKRAADAWVASALQSRGKRCA